MGNSENLIEVLSTCPVCGSSWCVAISTPRIKIGAAFFGEAINSVGLVKCRDCGLEFVNPRPGPEVLDEFYGMPGYPAHETSGDDSVSSFRFNFLGGLLSKTTLLDYGCGGGSFLQKARDAGWDVTGIEPSPVGRKNAQALGVEVYGRMEDIPAPRRFDLVTMFHVLEHVPDLSAVLSAVKRVMTDNGLLLVEVPNIRSFRAMVYKLPGIRKADDERYRAFPIHLYGFKRKTLARLLLKNGFCPVKETSFDLGWNVRPAEHKDNTTFNTGAAAWDGNSASGINLSLRRILKEAFFSLCLGERLLVAAGIASVHGSSDA